MQSLLDSYRSLLGADPIDQLARHAEPLVGLRVVEINSTAKGGGVAELLNGQIPLCAALGMDVQWFTLPPDDDFFAITKQLHNRLQGNGGSDQPLDMQYYQSYLSKVASTLPDADLYILHDPQTLGLAQHITKPMIWRCHIDLTDADPDTFDWLASYYPSFAHTIFSMPHYARGSDPAKTSIVQPAIDPLSDKNRALTDSETATILGKLGVNLDSPYILQVSRFDKFKNPMGVIDLHRATQKLIPGLRCILAGDYATDDPEGAAYFEQVKKYAEQLGDDSVQFIVGETGVQINALQQAASAVIQNSTREGFGLTVTEALWKQKVVFSRPVGGIVEQIIDGTTGFYLPDDLDAAAQLLATAIAQPQSYTAIGQNARQHVAKRFVLPVMLDAYLQVYAACLHLLRSGF